MVTLAIVTVSVPLLVTVLLRAAVAPSSMSLAPKARGSGAALSSVWIPVPLSATVSSGALEAIVADPVCEPVADGSNAIRRSHSSPTASASLVAQSPASPVSRVQPLSTVMPVNVTGSVPVFSITDVCPAVAPSSTSFEPKDRLSGSAVSCVWVPVPDSATVIVGGVRGHGERAGLGAERGRVEGHAELAGLARGEGGRRRAVRAPGRSGA